MTCNLKWLIEKFDAGDPIEYIFFLDHNLRHDGALGKFVLSQWFYSPFIVDDITYSTAAQWMMAHKARLFGDHQSFERLTKSGDIDEVKALGRQIQGFDEVKWNDKKFEIVKNGNIHKFSQDEKLKHFLLDTGNSIIVEANPNDTIWGIGLAEDDEMVRNPHAWKGQNLLGFALMEVRDFLRGY